MKEQQYPYLTRQDDWQSMPSGSRGYNQPRISENGKNPFPDSHTYWFLDFKRY